MDALRGEPPPEDPSASPSRRLEAQMRAGDGTVSRSPEQLRASSSRLEAKARGCVDDAEVIIAKRGAGLIDKYGLRGAAERIADLTGASVVSIVRTLEMESGLGDDDDDRKGTEHEGRRDEDDEREEERSGSDNDEGSDHEPQLEQVEYVHSDKSVSAAEILEEGIEDGRAPIRLRIIETGVVRRTSDARVLRGSSRSLRSGEDEAAKGRVRS